MSLEDFNKINNVDGEELVSAVEKKDTDNPNIIEFESIEYYLSHLDELLECVSKNYNNYINFKLKYEIKKDQYQVSLNWNEENALRVANDLPKITNQNQRDSVINLKLKNHYEKMKHFEMRYKFYNRLFDFISKNYDLLLKSYECMEKSEK